MIIVHADLYSLPFYLQESPSVDSRRRQLSASEELAVLLFYSNKGCNTVRLFTTDNYTATCPERKSKKVTGSLIAPQSLNQRADVRGRAS